MQILLVNAHGADLAYGGAERAVHELRDGLEAQGVACAVLSAFPGGDDRSPRLHVVHHTDWRTDRSRRLRAHVLSWLAPASGRATRVLEELAPDLVHTHNLGGIETGIWESARRRGIPVVHTLHDYHLLCPRATLLRRDGAPCRPHRLLCGARTRRLARWAPAVSDVIGVSAHVLAAHRGFFPGSADEHVIHAPGPRWPAAPRPAGGRLRVLGYAGALTVAKGVPLLLAAAPRLRALGITLRIAGDGPLREQVTTAPDLDYVGRLSGPARRAFALGCDAGIVPSVWREPGVTFAAREWLAAGRPVLATARGGLAELTGGGVQRISGTLEDLLARVTALCDGNTWRELVDGVETPSANETERWIEAHRRVYATALARAGEIGDG